MVTGIIGRKVGMTQVFDNDGTVHPATVIKAGPCVVVQAKTQQTDGYEAVQLAFVEESPAKVRKPIQKVRKPKARHRDIVLGVLAERLMMIEAEAALIVGDIAKENIKGHVYRLNELMDELNRSLKNGAEDAE